MKRVRWQSGFTLIEVALALGILSFSLVSIVGLFSVGLSQSRQNIDRSVEMQIMDYARSLARVEYEGNNLGSLDGVSKGFDADGLYTGEAQASSIYSATISQTNRVLPGSGQSLLGVAVVIKSPVRGNHVICTNAFWFSK